MANFNTISIRFNADLKQFSSQMQNANRQLQKTGQQMQKVGKGLTLGVTAPLVAMGYAGVDAWDKQAKAETALRTALKGSEKAFAALTKQASAFQEISLFGDEEIIKQQAFLSTMELNEQQIGKVIQAAMNLSAATGMSLESAVKNLAKTYGGLTGELGESIPALRNLTAEQLKSGEAINYVNTAFAGQAEAAAKAGTGGLKQLANSLGDLSEEFGKIITEALMPVVEHLKSAVKWFQGLDQSTKKMIVVVAALAAALGPLLVALGYMMTNVIPGLIKGYTKLRTLLIANPWTALALAVGAVAAALVVFTRSSSEASVVADTLNEVRKESATSIAKERAQLDTLLKIARDETRTKKEREAAIKALNNISPEYLGNISLETINTQNATDATLAYIAALDKKALAQAAMQKKQELFAKKIEKENERLSAVPDWLSSDSFWAMFGVETEVHNGIKDLNKYLEENVKAGTMSAAAAESMRKAYGPLIEKRKEELSVIDAQIEALNKYIDIPPPPVVAVNPNPTTTTITGIPESLQQESTRIQKEYDDIQQIIIDNGGKIDDLEAESQWDFHVNMKSEEFVAGVEQVKTSAEILEQRMRRLQEVGAAVGSSVANVFANFAGSIVDSLGLASSGFEGFVKGLADTVIRLISMMLAQSISQSIAGATASGAATGPAAIFTTPAFIATAVGGVLSAFAAIPKFADGGIVSGTTMGIMGEYAGARNNPEVIAPLDKLKGLIADSVGDGGGAYIAETKLRGQDLMLALKRTEASRNRRG
ncbi:MAG TPA: phage tail tape measure protein [Salinimicrobium sp.]|nr:phage tail tape measure protein [Salinimicrobium sp.]